MYSLNYDGLRRKETYDEVVDYIQNHQEKIKYPNRVAKQLRDSPMLSNLLDGNGDGLMEMNKQQNRVVEAQALIDKITLLASTSPLTTNQIKTLVDNKANDKYFNLGITDVDNEAYADETMEEMRVREQEMTAKKNKNRQIVNGILGGISDITGAVVGGAARIATTATLSAATGIATGFGNFIMADYSDAMTDVGDDADYVENYGNSSSASSSRGPVFGFGLNTVQAKQIDDLERETVDTLRKKLRTFDYTGAGITNNQIKGVAAGDVAGFKKSDLIREIRKFKG